MLFEIMPTDEKKFDQGWSCHCCHKVGVLELPRNGEWGKRHFVSCTSCGARNEFVPIYEDDGYLMDHEWKPA